VGESKKERKERKNEKKRRKNRRGLVTQVAGWGALDMFARNFSDVVQFVGVPITAAEACSASYQQMRVTLGPAQLCAGGAAGQDSCSGDSGSALMHEVIVLVKVRSFSFVQVIIKERSYDPRVIQVLPLA
jgi:hypothetical protein